MSRQPYSGDIPDYAIDADGKESLSALETLAWSSLSPEQLADKLAPRLWRGPILGVRIGRGGKEDRLTLGPIGVNKKRIDTYISTYAPNIRGAKRKELRELLIARTSKLFHERLCAWGVEVFKRSNGEIFNLQEALSSIVPAGCRSAVMRTISSALRRNWSEILETLSSCNCDQTL